jgi:hypothetical protein
VRIDEAGCDQRSAEVLDVIDIDDVLDRPRQSGRKASGRASPGNAIILHQNGCITPYLRTGPQPAYIGKESETHPATSHLAGTQADHLIAAMPPAKYCLMPGTSYDLLSE